ncbi:MAG: efflux transporter outer membrane subunit [Bacteroidota bacterium]|nr:efflux transporter outer membrane subunit [Bacteroidota bacterium]
MKKIIFRVLITGVSVVFLTSCVGRKSYERPELVDEKLFRTENISNDSLSSANVSWREIFTDEILQGYIDKALQNNLDIRVALQNIVSAEAYVTQAKQLYLPTLSISANYTKSTMSQNTQIGAIIGQRRYIDQWELAGNLSWEVDVWGKLSARNKATYASLLSTVVTHQAVKSEVVSSVAIAYYQLLMYDKQQKILEETVVLRQKGWETAKALKESGITTEIAVQQYEALLYNAKAQLITIQNLIWSLENSIAVLLGETPDAIARTSLEVQQFPKNFNQGYALYLLENRPDVMRAEQQLIHAFELTNVAKAAFYPSLTLTARGGFTAMDIEKWFSPQSFFANIIGGLVQPILNQKQIKTQYKVSQANQEIALLNFKKTLLLAGKEVSDAMQNFSSQDAFIQLKIKEMEAYQKATAYSIELFDNGMASYLEVVAAEVNRLNAELSVANAQFVRMQYGVTLYKALGGGWR